MRCERTHFARKIAYDSPSLVFDGREALKMWVVRFVGGIKAPRQEPVTGKQIADWFAGTKRAYVDGVLTELVTDGALVISPRSLGSSRRAAGVYVYTLPVTDAALGAPVNG